MAEKTKIVPRKPAATVAKNNKKEEPKKATKKEEVKKAPAKKAEPVKKAEPAAKKADGKDGNKKIYHVSKRDNDGREWRVFIQGSQTNIKICKTQAEALEFAKQYAKNHGNATVMLHGLDGKIRKA